MTNIGVFSDWHPWRVVRNYYLLTKPRIIPLLLMTTIAAMFMAGKGKVDWFTLVTTLTGGSLAAAAAQTFNCVYDRDIDAQMKRTRHRPIPSREVPPSHAIIFGVVLTLLSFTILAVGVNLWAALLAMVGIVFYLLVYTHWLKRYNSQSIVIGGAAGAIPPLVGWVAVTGDLSITAWALFLLVFLWTPPHFWSLALMIAEDYEEAGIPMLPVVAGVESTVRQICFYTLTTVVFSFVFVYPLYSAGLIYLGFASVLGFIFLLFAWNLSQQPYSKQLAKSTFKYSIVYLTLLSFGMVVDTIFSL